MRKTVSTLCLILFIFTLWGCTQKPETQKYNEIEKKIVGSWKFLYTDATEEAPPGDVIYIFGEDKTSILEFTDEKEEKRSIMATYEIKNNEIHIFKDEKLSKQFQVTFEDDNTLRLTEMQSKNSIILERQ